METLKQMIIEKIQKSKLDIQVVFKERALYETNQLLLESTANYDPSSKTIYISLKKIKEMLSTISIDEETAYVDSLIAHELGHASDVEVGENWRELKNHKTRWKELLVSLIVKKAK